MLPVCLKSEDITKTYGIAPGSRRPHKVLAGIDFEVHPGETLGIVGPSGSGKTTLARIITGQEYPTSGTVRLGEAVVHQMKGQEIRSFRRRVQMMFQNAESSLNPLKTLERSLTDVLILAGRAKSRHQQELVRILDLVGLSSELLMRFPRQLSGGQNQRMALARILLLNPDFLILDEPVSALDMSAKAQMLQLLKRLQKQRTLGYILISHDPDAVEFLSHRIFTLREGKLYNQ